MTRANPLNQDFKRNLGFSWDRDALSAPKQTTVRRAFYRYKQSLPQFVFDATALEGNPFTFVDVKTLMDGVTVGGYKISDERQVLNVIAASKELAGPVEEDIFRVNRATFDHLHELVAFEEALEWGRFRGAGAITDMTPRVSLGDREFTPPHPTTEGAGPLIDQFERGVSFLESEIENPLEQSMALFLFGAFQQFYFDGNKRTARLMMNGHLMRNGIDPISVPAADAPAFNEKMVAFYAGADATEMMEFLVACNPDCALATGGAPHPEGGEDRNGPEFP